MCVLINGALLKERRGVVEVRKNLLAVPCSVDYAQSSIVTCHTAHVL